MNTIKGGQGVNAQSFQLPPEMNKVISATTTDTLNGEVLFLHDSHNLFAAKITKTTGNVIFQRFNLPNIAKITPIIKNYFIALFNNNRLVIFEVWFNEEGKIMLRYAFNKNEKMYTSYFLREVVENMAEVHICYPQNEIYIYQFTVNGKVGSMSYLIGPQNKIKTDRQQLYGSKTIVCLDKKSLYYFTNFSNKCVNMMNIAKLEAQVCEQFKALVLGYVCIPKVEQHYMVLSNLVAINVTNSLTRYKISVDEAYMENVTKIMQRKDCASFSVSTYFDMIMISDSELNQSIVFQIKQKASSMIAFYDGNFNWFWTSTRKLVGLSSNRNSFKLIQNLKLQPKNGLKQETIQFVIDQRKNQIVKQEKQIDYENKSDDFLVKPTSNSDVIQDSKGDPQTKSQVHSFRNLPQKKVQTQAALSQKIEPKRQVQEIVQPKLKFVPNKIIQKKGVSVSKILTRSKEIQPISKSQQPTIKEKTEQLKKVPQQQQKGVQANQIQQQIQAQKEQIIPIVILEENSLIKIEVKQNQEQNQKQIQETTTNQKKNQKIQTYGQKQIEKQNTETQKQEQIQNNQVSNVKQQAKIEQIAQQKSKESKQQSNNYSEDSLSKNLALMIQKNNIAGFPSFSSSINRNKIFSSTSVPFGKNLFTQGLRKIQSESSPQQYYNPFLSQSPLHTAQVQKQNIGQISEVLIQQSPTESQIQKFNVRLIQKIKELFQTTTTKLLKSIQEVGNINTSEAYLKQKVREEVEKKVIQTLKNHVNGELTSRLELYFREVFRQTSAVQEDSIRFYKQAALHRTTHIEVQLNNQEKILRQIKDVQSMIRFSISQLRAQTSEIYQNLMSEWTIKFKQSKEIIDNIVSVKHKLEEESVQKTKRFEEIKKNLQTIKNKLIEKSVLQEERKQKKLQEKANKLKQQAEKKAKGHKKTQRKLSGEKDRKSKFKKGIDV